MIKSKDTPLAKRLVDQSATARAWLMVVPDNLNYTTLSDNES